MKLCFLPGKLFLDTRPDGTYELRLGDEVRIFRSKRPALQAFQELRARLEEEFPAKEPSIEERRALLHKEIADSAIGHNSLRNAGPKKKTGTRRFG